jgi:phage baseplate assembly protein W
MAIPINNQTLNLNPIQQAIGVDIPFNAPGVFYSTFDTRNATQANLINFFLTNRRERIFNINFGGNLQSLLFSQLTEENLLNIENNIKTQLNMYFPRVEVTNINIQPNPDYNQVTISISYNIINSGITDTINLTFG